MNSETKNILELFLKEKKQSFRCKKCNKKSCKVYKSKSLIICDNCSSSETLSSHTAFHHQHISIEKALKILLDIQENYMEFTDELKNILAESESKTERYFDGELIKTTTKARLSIRQIANQFHLQTKTVKRFISRVGNWMTVQYRTSSPAELNWSTGLKTKSSLKIYNGLFNLLFEGDEPLNIEPRDVSHIISYLVVKRFHIKFF